MFSRNSFSRNSKLENLTKDGSSNLRAIKIVIMTPFLVSVCASPLIQKSPPESKFETLKTSVCESESYVGNTDYKQRSEKEYLNKLKNGEEVYLQTVVERCEARFIEEGDLECGLQKTIKLIWEKNNKLIDSFSFLDSGCEEPNSSSLRMEPWDQNNIIVKKDVVNVIHYWNYYSHSNEDERCMSHSFRLDRRKMKFHDLGEKSCRKGD